MSKTKSPQKTRILILGGGFGGVTTAQDLSKIFNWDASVEITLVNRDNYFVFVPMLASAAAGSLEPLHMVVPIRHLIPGVKFRAEEVINIDLENKQVTTIAAARERESLLSYDHLVLALGNVVNLARLPGVAEHGKALKTLGDAIAIRNHVLQMFEAADLEPSLAKRRQMLTFVVAGGGFSGVEMVGELNDMLCEILKHYPTISRTQIRVVLLHSRDRILPEMLASTADYVLRKLRQNGIEVILNVRLSCATPTEVVLKDGKKIPTRTLIAAIGNAPPPVIQKLAVKKEYGKIVVNEFMQVPDYPAVWALGDNALVPNGEASSPPTAQYAARQGKRLAKNIAATIRDRQMTPFAFGGLGLLCAIGHRDGVGELPFNIQLKGFWGWFIWRGVYWAKLPTLLRKIQVGFDWFLQIFMERELAHVNLARTQSINRAHYESGEKIFSQGDLGQHFYMIMDGKVEIVREQSEGQEIVLNRLVKGEYFGETALLKGRRRNATVRCLTPVNVMMLGRDDFTMLTDSWGQLAQNVKQVSEQRSHEMADVARRS